MRKHIVEGPLAAARGLVQSSSRQTCGELGDGLRLLRELEQDLVDRERSVVHGDMLGSRLDPCATAPNGARTNDT